MFTVSPGVNVSEIDLTTGVTSVSTTQAAIAGVFRWGPANKRFKVTSEPDLVAKTLKPTSFNAETWFSAASFLSYSNDLTVVRVTTGTSAMAVFSGSTAPNANTQTVLNEDLYDDFVFSANVAYVARYAGAPGNSLKISTCDSPNAYYKAVTLVPNSDIASTSNAAFSVGGSTAVFSFGFAGAGTQLSANAAAYGVQGALQVGDQLKVGNSTIGTQYLKITDLGSVTSNSTIAKFTLTFATPYRLGTAWSGSSVDRYWEFYDRVSAAPSTSQYVSSFGNTSAKDEIHVVVVDRLGKFSGVPGTVLETYAGLSRATNAKTENGASNYYKTVINAKSPYVYWSTDRTGALSANAASISTASTDTSLNINFQGGDDGLDENSISLGSILSGYDLFKSADEVDTSLVITGKSRLTDGVTQVNYAIDNIGETRKDCVVFASPPKEYVVNGGNTTLENVIGYSNSIRSSSYAFIDSGYKYMYDKYNDVYRWVPLNGDIAGLCARTDVNQDPWWSPAGYSRGQIKNVTKLAWNPSQTERDALYKVNVNAVIKQNGTGPILFGDKTHLMINSAFSRINVRRLFIVLEKSIAIDSKNMLFEFNDEFTRSQFRSRIVPYLRDVHGRRGIIDFLVICDESNNTGQVIDNEQFVGDIYIKPNRAINSIQLNFVAVRSGVQFSEIVGQA
jgi:hypothetical protein